MDSNRENIFLEKFKAKNKAFGFYLLGSFIIITFSFFGQFPMLLFLPDGGVTGSSALDFLNDLDSNLSLTLLLIPSLTAFIGFLFVLRFLHQQTLTMVTTSRKKIDYQRIIFGFTFWALLSCLVFLIDWRHSPKRFMFNFEWQPFLIMVLIGSLLIPFQSALEEWLFRGYLMQGFASMTKSRLISLVFTSIIFGSLHILNPEVEKLGYGLMAYYIGTGLFFGIISLMDEGIELAIGFHVANNLITAILVTADWTAFQTASLFKDVSEPELIPDLILFLGIIYPLTLIFLAKKYQWGNWKYKLTAKINE